MTTSSANVSRNTLAGVGGVRVESGSGCGFVIDNVINASSFGVQSTCAATQIQNNTVNGTAVGVLISSGGGTIHGNTFNGCATTGVQILAGSPTLTSNSFTGGVGALTAAAISVGATTTGAIAAPRIRGSTLTTLPGVVGIEIQGSGLPDLGTAADPGNNKLGVTRLVLGATGVTVNAIGNEWAPPSPATPTCSPPLPTAQVQVTGAGSALVYGAGGGQSCHNP